MDWETPNLTTLDNGLRVITYPTLGSTSVSVNVCVEAGSKYEALENAGLSHFIEHILFKGTKQWPTPEQLSGTIENCGGDINAITSKEYTMYWSKVPYTEWKMATNVLLDMCINPLIDPEEINRERGVIHEELRMYTDQPSYRADLGIEQIMFPDHPMGMEIIGSHESLEELNHQDIQQYFVSRYNPTKMILTAVGNFQEAELLNEVADACKRWTCLDSHNFDVASMKHPETHQLITFDQESDHTYINLGLKGLKLTDPLAPLLNLTNIILGEGMSSRLFVKIRERLGLAYDISSSTSNYVDTGTWIINCSVKQSNCIAAIEAILDELHSVPESITYEELTNVKQFAKGKLLLTMEDTERLSSFLAIRTLLSGELLDFNTLIAQWDKFTLEELHDNASVLIKNTPKFLSVGGTDISDHQFALSSLLT
tara:strand:+ start:39489 stop:40769 length:1281 start_codon:yes stop_codon:yes gene_type:complete